MAAAVKHLKAATDRRQAVEDLGWVLDQLERILVQALIGQGVRGSLQNPENTRPRQDERRTRRERGTLATLSAFRFVARWIRVRMRGAAWDQRLTGGQFR